MKVTLLRAPNLGDWQEVKRRALVTAGYKKAINPPSLEWCNKMLQARHSPIRYLQISFFIEELPYWVSNELCRHHIGIEKYVKSQRNDRQSNYDRAAARQDSPVNVIVDFNAEGFLNFCNKRLCGKASKEMRDLAAEMRDLLIKNNPEFNGVLVPNCIYHNGKCYELEPCKKL